MASARHRPSARLVLRPQDLLLPGALLLLLPLDCGWLVQQSLDTLLKSSHLSFGGLAHYVRALAAHQQQCAPCSMGECIGTAGEIIPQIQSWACPLTSHLVVPQEFWWIPCRNMKMDLDAVLMGAIKEVDWAVQSREPRRVHLQLRPDSPASCSSAGKDTSFASMLRALAAGRGAAKQAKAMGVNITQKTRCFFLVFWGASDGA